MRPLTPLAALSLTLALAACGSDDEDPPAAAPTSAAPTVAAAPASPAPAAGSTTLIGTLGTPGDADAFEIGLTREDGTAVETLPAGTYTIKVDDQTAVHNWHLSGDGVDVETGVSAKESKEFSVTLTAGEYEYVCDPHPSMTGSITVT